MDDAALPALFRPITLRGLTIRNRIAVSPMCQYLARNGVPNEWHFAHHARFALGGVGLVIAEATGVTHDGRITPACTGMYDEAQVAAWRRITDLHRSHGVASAIQLGHSGGKGSTAEPWKGAGQLEGDTGWEIVAASAVAMRPGWKPPRPATIPEIEAIIEAFAAAAKRAVAAGFDAIELHGAHGYLLHSFFSPITNKREDAFGGSREKRMRLPLLVAEAVRKAIPAAMPLIYRASVVDNVEGGLVAEDTVALARELKKAGVDLIDCSASGAPGALTAQFLKLEHGFQVHLAEAVRRGAGIAAMAVGMITDPAKADAIIAEGRADMIAIGREMISDASWPYHAAIALGHPAPESLLPVGYNFHLERRAKTQGR